MASIRFSDSDGNVELVPVTKLTPVPKVELVEDDRPLLLWDVDGVLCPYNGRKHIDGHEVFAPRRREEGDGWDVMTVLLNPDTRDLLQRLGEKFQFVWATLWEDSANDLLAEWLGVPRMPVCKFMEGGPHWPPSNSADQSAVHRFVAGSAGGTYKLPFVADFVKDKPFVWVDDSMGPDAHHFAEWRNSTGRPTMFVQPEMERGFLRDPHFHWITDWHRTLRSV